MGYKRPLLQLKPEEKLEIYDLVFSTIHSDGFKKAEVSDLFTDNYNFFEKPKDNWKEKLTEWLNERNFVLPSILNNN